MVERLRHTVPSTDSDALRKFTVTPLPSELKVPDSTTHVEREGPPVVTNQEVAWNEISRMSENIRGLVQATNNQARYVEQIPEIKAGVEAANIASRKALQKVEVVHTKLGTQMTDIARRVERVEDRDYECSQVMAITELREQSAETRRKVERDVTEGVKTRERLDNTRDELDTVDTEVKKFSTARRGLFISLIGVALFVASTVGTLIWFLSELETKFEAEQRERRDSDSRIELQVKVAGKASNTAPVTQEVQALTRAVKAANGHETTVQYCSGLSERAVRLMKRAVPRDEWPSCRRFGLEPIRHRE